MSSEINEGVKRSIFARILFGVLWFVPIYFLSFVIVGAVVGGIAGASTTTYEAGQAAGEAAAAGFFQQYGGVLFIGLILLTAGLSVAGVLPGTAKWKAR